MDFSRPNIILCPLVPHVNVNEKGFSNIDSRYMLIINLFIHSIMYIIYITLVDSFVDNSDMHQGLEIPGPNKITLLKLINLIWYQNRKIKYQ